jgi:glycosyltransferase involved in cell wall biosynthesis
MNTAAPKVSVCVMTYNQEAFVGECLESIVTQQTDFPFEVIVADDGSADRTADIIRQYEASHPHLVRGVLHAKNIGVKANYLSSHEAARGEYVAHMDGDDLMLPGKLQRQADFLDAHPGLALVGANAIAFSTEPDGSHRYEGETSSELHPEVMTFDAFIERNGFLFTHSSKMYRRDRSPDMRGESRLFDVQMHVLQAANGGAGYIHEPLGKYRINAGISVGRDGLRDHILSIEMGERLGASPASVRYAFARACFEGALTSLRDRDFREFRRRIELSARYGALRRPKDRVWRAVLLRLRRAPVLLEQMLALKEQRARGKRRRA